MTTAAAMPTLTRPAAAGTTSLPPCTTPVSALLAEAPMNNSGSVADVATDAYTTAPARRLATTTQRLSRDEVARRLGCYLKVSLARVMRGLPNNGGGADVAESLVNGVIAHCSERDLRDAWRHAQRLAESGPLTADAWAVDSYGRVADATLANAAGRIEINHVTGLCAGSTATPGIPHAPAPITAVGSALPEATKLRLRQTLVDLGAAPAPSDTLLHVISDRDPEFLRLWDEAVARDGLGVLGTWLTASPQFPGLYLTPTDVPLWHGAKPDAPGLVTFTMQPDQLFFDPYNPAHIAVYDEWRALAGADDPCSWVRLAVNGRGESLEPRLRARFHETALPTDPRFYIDLGLAGIREINITRRNAVPGPDFKIHVLLNPLAVREVAFGSGTRASAPRQDQVLGPQATAQTIETPASAAELLALLRRSPTAVFVLADLLGPQGGSAAKTIDASLRLLRQQAAPATLGAVVAPTTAALALSLPLALTLRLVQTLAPNPNRAAPDVLAAQMMAELGQSPVAERLARFLANDATLTKHSRGALTVDAALSALANEAYACGLGPRELFRLSALLFSVLHARADANGTLQPDTEALRELADRFELAARD